MSEKVSNRRAVLQSALGLAAVAALPRGVFAKSSAKATATMLNQRLLVVSGLGGNVVVLRGDEGEGLLLIDSGAPGATAALQSELKKFARGAKVAAVINTHWHADQTGGNDAFGKGGAKIIAHAKAAQRMAIDQYVPWEDRYIKARDKVAVPTEIFYVGSSRVDLQACKLEYSIVSPK